MLKERPILFNADMVRALLDRRKTQTRRIVKPQPPASHQWHGWVIESSCRKDEGKATWAAGDGPLLVDPHRVRCPYGQPGDRLWVKETWRPQGVLSPWDLEVTYAADGEQRIIKDGEFGDKDWNMPKAAARGNVSPLFMPRWASRITLEIVSVRVERLHEMNTHDARAEGCPGGHGSILGYGYSATPGEHFRDVWQRINGADSWDANPWVWVVEFKQVEASQ